MTEEFEFHSSMLSSPASYDEHEEGGLLTLTFCTSGRTFVYTDFPRSEWEAFKATDSHGHFWHVRIKGKYPFREA